MRTPRRPRRCRLPHRAAGRAPVDAGARVQRLVERCREAGMNVTPQRLVIYRALVESQDHPSPEALFERVRPALPSLSLATIYKTLEALARLGLVDELPTTGNARRYDGNTDRHHHLVCTRCSRVVDYDDPALDRIAAPARLPGFTAHHLTVTIHGLCAACAAAEAVPATTPNTPRRQTAWPS